MKSVPENIELSEDQFHQFPWGIEHLTLHPKFPSGNLHRVQSPQRQMAITLVVVR